MREIAQSKFPGFQLLFAIEHYTITILKIQARFQEQHCQYQVSTATFSRQTVAKSYIRYSNGILSIPFFGIAQIPRLLCLSQ